MLSSGASATRSVSILSSTSGTPSASSCRHRVRLLRSWEQLPEKPFWHMAHREHTHGALLQQLENVTPEHGMLPGTHHQGNLQGPARKGRCPSARQYWVSLPARGDNVGQCPAHQLRACPGDRNLTLHQSVPQQCSCVCRAGKACRPVVPPSHSRRAYGPKGKEPPTPLQPLSSWL